MVPPPREVEGLGGAFRLRLRRRGGNEGAGGEVGCLARRREEGGLGWGGEGEERGDGGDGDGDAMRREESAMR